MQGRLASPGVGMLAPDFALSDAAGRRITRSDLLGQPAILAFYPPDWDPARTEQLAHFNAIVSRVPGVNAELLGITTDGLWCNLAFTDDEVRVPLLADLDPFGKVAELFDVRGERAVFVLDAHGVIRWHHVGALNAADMDVLVDALAALAPDPDAPRSLLSEEAEECRSFTSFRTTVVLSEAPALERSEGKDLHFTPKDLHLDPNDPLFDPPTRREFLATALAAAVLLAASPLSVKAESVAKALTPSAPKPIPVTLNVNGRDVTLNIEPRVTLLDALREYAGLTGTKKGCDHGQCGACTVHVNGRRQLSCLTFAVMHTGAKITTVEGLATGDTLHPMQAAFIKHDGFQCGYCTPGQLMSATAILSEPCGSADVDVKECMSGNVCRCGAYPGIVAAIQEVRATRRG
jgi:xanthine dehydrogenase YagT iron-sulfur-binding subunit